MAHLLLKDILEERKVYANTRVLFPRAEPGDNPAISKVDILLPTLYTMQNIFHIVILPIPILIIVLLLLTHNR